MPPPITHTLFAQRLMWKRFPGINLRALIVGTNFPDIRNLSGHPREHTHAINIRAEDVLSAADVFRMGMKLHSYVDALHWRVIEEAGETEAYYDRKRIVSVAWKIVEDELLHERMPDKDEVISFFDDVLEDEMDFGIEEDHIETWHTCMQAYLALPPAKGTTKDRLAALGIRGGRADAVEAQIGQFRENTGLSGIVEQAIERFDMEIAV